MANAYVIGGEIVDEDELLGALRARRPVKGSPRQPSPHPSISMGDQQFLAAMGQHVAYRQAVVHQALQLGDISVEHAEVFLAGAEQLQLLLAESAAELASGRSVDWNLFWRNLPPLGTNFGGAFGAAINANANAIVKMVNKQRGLGMAMDGTLPNPHNPTHRHALPSMRTTQAPAKPGFWKRLFG